MTSVRSASDTCEVMLTSLDVGIAAQPFLNEALDEGKLESGGVSEFKCGPTVANQESDPPDLHLCEPP